MFPFRYGRRNSVHLLSRATHMCVGGLWFQVCIVDAGVLRIVGFVGCVTSPRPISTGRLGIAAVHLRPINPMVCGGPYPIAGWETLS